MFSMHWMPQHEWKMLVSVSTKTLVVESSVADKDIVECGAGACVLVWRKSATVRQLFGRLFGLRDRPRVGFGVLISGAHPALVSYFHAVRMQILLLGLLLSTAMPAARAFSLRGGALRGREKAPAVAMAAIESIVARQIYDSRGNPTVEVDVLADGVLSRASVPSGASTGAYEAVELRDGGDAHMGKGVLGAVANVNAQIAPALLGMDVTSQASIDQKMLELDGTPNKAKLGANAILGVSLAVSKAGASTKGVPLYRHYADLAGNTKLMMPVPCFNVINGGSHAGNKLPFQEYFVIPTGAKSFAEAMRIGSEVYHNLAKILKAKFGGDATLIGDEGGFAPPCDARSGIELVMEAIEKAGYAGLCTVGLDVAASEFKVKGSPNGADAQYAHGEAIGVALLPVTLPWRRGHLLDISWTSLGHLLDISWTRVAGTTSGCGTRSPT
jgi:hypothetical protein